MIRDASPNDADAIAVIYNHFVANSVATFEETPISADEMAERISATQIAGYPFLVLERDGKIVGYAYGGRWKSRAAYRHTVEVSVYVDPNEQGKGIGMALYTALFERLREGSYHAVMGVITLPNPASAKLHERFGLKKVAHFTEVGRKFDRWIDVGYWQGFL